MQAFQEHAQSGRICALDQNRLDFLVHEKVSCLDRVSGRKNASTSPGWDSPG
jgi:hypothetical protein